jgi:hypothetical protein
MTQVLEKEKFAPTKVKRIGIVRKQQLQANEHMIVDEDAGND